MPPSTTVALTLEAPHLQHLESAQQPRSTAVHSSAADGLPLVVWKRSTARSIGDLVPLAATWTPWFCGSVRPADSGLWGEIVDRAVCRVAGTDPAREAVAARRRGVVIGIGWLPAGADVGRITASAERAPRISHAKGSEAVALPELRSRIAVVYARSG